MDNAWPHIKRAWADAIPMPKAITIFLKPPPSPEEITRARRIIGIDMMASVSLIMIAYVMPPEYAAINPTLCPMVEAINTETNPTTREVLEP